MEPLMYLFTLAVQWSLARHSFAPSHSFSIWPYESKCGFE